MRRENPLRFKGKVALLVNRGSASASEIAAAALQESKRAVVIGRKTAGAVLTSQFVSVGDGYSMQIPVGDYKTAKGVRLEGTGVTPEVEVLSPSSRTVESVAATRCVIWLASFIAGCSPTIRGKP